MITFKEVDGSNYQAVAQLDVKGEQQEYVAKNWYSLLEATYEEEEHIPFAIYAEDTLVGFLLYAYFPADDDYPVDSWWLLRLMIDKDHQQKGYGREALERFLQYFHENYPTEDIRLGVEEENTVAQKLYEDFGFTHEGVVDGENAFVKKWD